MAGFDDTKAWAEATPAGSSHPSTIDTTIKLQWEAIRLRLCDTIAGTAYSEHEGYTNATTWPKLYHKEGSGLRLEIAVGHPPEQRHVMDCQPLCSKPVKEIVEMLSVAPVIGTEQGNSRCLEPIDCGANEFFEDRDHSFAGPGRRAQQHQIGMTEIRAAGLVEACNQDSTALPAQFCGQHLGHSLGISGG